MLPPANPSASVSSPCWLAVFALAATAVQAIDRTGLRIDITNVVECTRKSRVGDTIQVDYRGTLQSDGTEFDSSYNRGVPFEFKLGQGMVIAGWDQGLTNMCIGEERKLTIPPELAYGDRNVGSIPSDSTLVFETRLEGITGVETEDPVTESPTVASTATSGSAAQSNVVLASPSATATLGPQGGGEEDDGECHLLGPFALLVQGALGVLALTSLVYKRWRETPRRPLKIWWFDVSKQVFGSVLIHVANLFMSMLSSGSFDVNQKAKEAASFVQDATKTQPNPCSFYLLNLAIDTTIGIPILVVLLRLLHHGFLLTPLANPPESIRSGNYGQPPRVSWWLKQSIIYFLGLFGMKLVVFFIFQLLPWIAWVGDWALRWTEGNEAIQITFVMFIFPLIMNALQYYIIDSFIKDPAGGAHEMIPDGEGDEHAHLTRGRQSDSDGESSDEEVEIEDYGKDAGGIQASGPLEEANPTPLPARSGGGSNTDGEGSSRGSTVRSADYGREKPGRPSARR
ncbi:Vaculolar membrane protein-domain-containing protein [Lineolata rhizophorae]|uniref:peptidylprolyl isomerase n=1 Tax=Lineolata rhizophorae TaxID=578093 RepID=A0A6A6NUR5_9PEZI|nr:Vaculolar membrane protein-domain-containing protein [Lineolata rhizophorae]